MTAAVDNLFEGVGVILAMIFLILVILLCYALSVMWWSIFISAGFHIAGDPHSWWWACNHWGLLAPFVLG